MSGNDIEKEVKLRLEDPEEIIRVLKARGAVCRGRVFQHTIRLDDRAGSLGERGVSLRVRTGLGQTVTVKRKLADAHLAVREEYEAEVADIEVFRRMFRTLGFDWERVMDKYRMDFAFRGTLVSVDELPFGFFMEIEGEEDGIMAAAGALGFGPEEMIGVSYWKLFEEHKRASGLAAESIEFAPGYASRLMGIEWEKL